MNLSEPIYPIYPIESTEIHKLFWQKKWKIPGTSWIIEGYSRSAYRTGFFIKDLNLMLDAGPQRFDRPESIMITHTHGDHIALLPFTMIGSENAGKNYTIHVFGPEEAQKHVQNYINVLFETNGMIEPVPQSSLDKYYIYHGLTPHTSFTTILKGEMFIVEVFECDHRIPTVSYGLTQLKNKILPKYEGLSGKEIASLRMSGTEVTGEVPFKRFAYVCDTTIRVFELNDNLLTYPVIFIECTYITADEPFKDALKSNTGLAEDKSHIYWKDLQHIVVAHPEIQFMTFHFSRRYKDSEIANFFEAEKKRLNINNLNYWA